MRITALLLSAVLTATLFASVFFVNISSSLGEWDPLFDWDMSGKIDPADFAYFASIYGAEGTPINWTQLLEDIDNLTNRVAELESRIVEVNATLLSDVDILNATLISLNITVASLLERINLVETQQTLVNSTYNVTVKGTTETLSWVDMDSMSLQVRSNRTSHVVIIFSTEAKVEGTSPENWTDASIRIRALVDETIAYPADIYLNPTVSQELGYPTTHRHGLNYSAYSYVFYQLSVPQGDHTIKIQWRVTGSTGYVRGRTLTVIAFPTP